MPAAALRHRPWSIRARLVLLVLSVWLPAVVALGLLARSTFEHEESAARARMRDTAENLNVAIESELDKAGVLARAMSASAALDTGDLVRFHEEATRVARESGHPVFLLERERQLVNTLLPGPRVVQRPLGSP